MAEAKILDLGRVVGHGVPSGGKAGYIPEKLSDDDYDIGWRHPPSNINLLDNGHFADPINQRNGKFITDGVTYYSDAGLTTSAGTTTTYYKITYVSDVYSKVTINDTDYYVAAADVRNGYLNDGYTIDRWYNSGNMMATLTDGGITLRNFSRTTTFAQYLDMDTTNFIEGKTVTLSTLTTAGNLMHITIPIPKGKGFDSGRISSNGWMGNLIRYTDSSAISVRFYSTTPGTEIGIAAVKLELGDHQTLAHQDASGKWILNDPPPNKILENIKYTISPVDNDGKGANTASDAIAALGAATDADLTSHTSNGNIHVTANDKAVWNGKQNALTFDSSPKSGSSNPVTSGGLYSKFEEKVPWTKFSNPNLLDNWYFADPINQRGKTAYTEAGYTIDRWTNDGGMTISLVNGGITLLCNSGTPNFYQPLDIDIVNFIQGKIVTYSILTTSGDLMQSTISIPKNKGFDSGNMIVGNGWVADLVRSSDSAEYISLRIYSTTIGSTLNVAAIKLEVGDHQTLARQDASGKWILNDPPPDRALELLNCQRYQIFGKLFGTKVWTYSATNIGVFFPTPSIMRATPTLVGQLIYLVNNSVTANVYPVNFSMESNHNGVYMYLAGSGIDLSSVTYFEIPAGSGFDANL